MHPIPTLKKSMLYMKGGAFLFQILCEALEFIFEKSQLFSAPHIPVLLLPKKDFVEIAGYDFVEYTHGESESMG